MVLRILHVVRRSMAQRWCRVARTCRIRAMRVADWEMRSEKAKFKHTAIVRKSLLSFAKARDSVSIGRIFRRQHRFLFLRRGHWLVWQALSNKAMACGISARMLSKYP